MNNLLVSIVMPSYNSIYISESIESIIAQSYTNWELLITDDCSSDSTRDIVAEYLAKDPRIKLFVLDKNLGAGVARNNSIERAKGRFIAFCDSDDIWLPDKLEKQVNFMLKNNYEFTFTSYYICNKEMEITNVIKCKNVINLFSLVRDCSVGCLTAMYDVQALNKVMMPTFRKRQDWGLWFLIIKKSKYGYGLEDICAKYRVSPNSISSNKLSLIKYNLKVYSDVLNYSLLKSYLLFFLIFLPTVLLKKIKLPSK